MAGLGKNAQVDSALMKIWASSLPRLQAQLESLEEYEKALATGAATAALAEAAERDAHKLAGIMGTFGFPECSEAASRIERAAGGGPSLRSDVRADVQVLRRVLRPES